MTSPFFPPLSLGMKQILCSAILCALLLTGCSPERQATGFDVDGALAECDRQVHRALAQLGASGAIDTTMMPRNVAPRDSAWSCRPLCAEEWCSGFWPGILWLDYEAQLAAGRMDESALQVRRAAIDATMAMHRVVDRPVFDHDLGFLIFCSAGTGLRVLRQEMERTDLSRQQRAESQAAAECFRTLCLRAADSLATLFNPTVGTILSWPRNIQMFGGHNTIMDNMINLEMLCWAAEEGGKEGMENERVKNERVKNEGGKSEGVKSEKYDEPKSANNNSVNRKLYDIAVRHAETTRRHHFRPDGTCYHVAVYDTLDGHFIHGVTHQGLADSSTWARGQAWAVYGFTTMYRFTRDGQFLEMARQAADAFLRRLQATSDDWVPLWDFDDPRGLQAPKDASAACIVASSLLELQGYLGAEDGKPYYEAACNMLRDLSSDAYRAAPQSCAFLLHSTGNLPAGSEIDVPIIYADYYYLEALNRYKALNR